MMTKWMGRWAETWLARLTEWISFRRPPTGALPWIPRGTVIPRPSARISYHFLPHSGGLEPPPLHSSSFQFAVCVSQFTEQRTVVSYVRYDHRLRLALWIGRIVAAIHVVRPLSYRTCDLRSWIGREGMGMWIKLEMNGKGNEIEREWDWEGMGVGLRIAFLLIYTLVFSV